MSLTEPERIDDCAEWPALLERHGNNLADDVAGLPQAAVKLGLKTDVSERVATFGPLSPARGRAQTDLPVYMLSTLLRTSLGCGELMWLPPLVSSSWSGRMA